MCSELKAVKRLMDELGIGSSVAFELVELGGDDVDMIIRKSRESNGLDQCRSKVIGERFRRIEAKLDETC